MDIKVGNVVVSRYQILGTPYVGYHVWMPGGDILRPGGSHITKINGRWYYELRTKDLPARLDSLPAYSEERFRRVTAYQRRLKKASLKLIKRAFPDANPNEQFIEKIK